MKVLKEPLNDSGRFMFNKIYSNVSGFLVVPVLLFFPRICRHNDNISG